MTKQTEALRMVIKTMGNSIVHCEDLHHAKKDQHKDSEPCPVEQRWHTTIQACKEALEQPTRLEVIDANGRTYTNWKVKELQFSYQDNGKTLKIFVTEVQND